MDYQNVLDIPGVTVTFEYRLWGPGGWITDVPNPIEISGGKLLVDNFRSSTGDNPAWWSFRVYVVGIPYPASVRAVYDMQQTSIYGDNIFVGEVDGEFSGYIYGSTSGNLDGSVASGESVFAYKAGYDAGRIRGEITLLVGVVPPFWQKFVYSKEII